MAANGQMLAVGGVLLFVGGCWAGMGSQESGDRFCVVVPETAAAHPGFTAGQFVEAPADGCLDGEHQVCGSFEGDGEDRRFESQSCE